jgi:hypothetical protein
MHLKPGAKIVGMRPEISWALSVCEGVLTDAGYKMTVTEVTGGVHSPGSLHYVGLAADIRSRDIPKDKQEPIRAEMKTRLGAEFDVVLESDHFHLECQPKHPIGA